MTILQFLTLTKTKEKKRKKNYRFAKLVYIYIFLSYFFLTEYTLLCSSEVEVDIKEVKTEECLFTDTKF